MATNNWLDLFGLSSPFGSAAAMPFTRSTSSNLPFQDVLFNAFQNRQSIFSPSTKASGSPDAATASPFYNQLNGGGLAWSYDPNWMSGLFKPQRDYPDVPEILTGGGGHKKKPADVHGGPAEGPIPWDPNDPFGPLTGSTPPTEQLGPPPGHWEWYQDHWTWVGDTWSDPYKSPTI